MKRSKLQKRGSTIQSLKQEICQKLSRSSRTKAKLMIAYGSFVSTPQRRGNLLQFVLFTYRILSRLYQMHPHHHRIKHRSWM